MSTDKGLGTVKMHKSKNDCDMIGCPICMASVALPDKMSTADREACKAEEWPLSPNWWLSIRNKRGEGRFEKFDFITITATSGEYERPITDIMVPRIDGVVAQSHSFISLLIHQNIEHFKAELKKEKKSNEQTYSQWNYLYTAVVPGLEAENERLRQELEEVKAKYDELKSYLPKVPTQPYEKELAEENERLRQELATANEFRAKWQKAFRDSEARAEKLVVALKFYSDRKKWDEILMLEGAVFGNCEGDPAIVFDAEDDSPWEVARNALAEWEKK